MAAATPSWFLQARHFYDLGTAIFVIGDYEGCLSGRLAGQVEMLEVTPMVHLCEGVDGKDCPTKCSYGIPREAYWHAPRFRLPL